MSKPYVHTRDQLLLAEITTRDVGSGGGRFPLVDSMECMAKQYLRELVHVRMILVGDELQYKGREHV